MPVVQIHTQPVPLTLLTGPLALSLFVSWIAIADNINPSFPLDTSTVGTHLFDWWPYFHSSYLCRYHRRWLDCEDWWRECTDVLNRLNERSRRKKRTYPWEKHVKKESPTKVIRMIILRLTSSKRWCPRPTALLTLILLMQEKAPKVIYRDLT